MASDPMGIGVKLEGAKELQRTLERLGATQQRRVIRPAVTKALSPLVKEAKRRCPVGVGGVMRAGGSRSRPGAMKRSIGKRVKSYKYSETVWGGVGPRKGFEDDPGNRVHWVEFGRPRHNVPAQPFLRESLRCQRPRVTRILITGIWAGIRKLARLAGS